MSGTVQAVIFDWGGTLTPWHDIEVGAQWSAFAQQVHQEQELVTALHGRLCEAEDAAWKRARQHSASARFADIVTDAGLDPAAPEHAAAVAAYEQFWEPHTLTDAQVRPLWQALADRGIKVGVLSNTIWSRQFHREVFARDGVLDLIDADVYSSEVPWAKPHPEIFREAARRLEVQESACVYVGDRLYEDVYGPQQVGMKGVHVPHSNLPSAQVVPVEVTPDAVLHELLDLVPIVDDWA